MEGSDDIIEPLSPEEEVEEEEEESSTKKKKKSNRNNKRRFSDEQVRSLETIFASETKLEPKKKVQVARELGLQPRQVAIWFQNKRARWKSKQIEKNYRLLKANYDNLKARFEAMKMEKESLLEQLQELHSLLERSHNSNRSSDCKDMTVVENTQNMSREDEDHGITALAAKSGSLQEEMDHQPCSDDDKSENMAYLGKEEPEFVNISENMGDSIVSPVKWCSFDAGNIFDQSSSNLHWWDSWT